MCWKVNFCPFWDILSHNSAISNLLVKQAKQGQQSNVGLKRQLLNKSGRYTKKFTDEKVGSHNKDQPI